MDNPSGVTERAGGSARAGGQGPGPGQQQGAMSGRRVSVMQSQSRAQAVPTISMPTNAHRQFEWISAHRQLNQSIGVLEEAGAKTAAADFRDARLRISNCILYRCKQVGVKVEGAPRQVRQPGAAAERKYLAVEASLRHAEAYGSVVERRRIKFHLDSICRQTNVALASLIRKYGSIDAKAILPRLHPASVVSGTGAQPVSKPAATLSEPPLPVTLPAATTAPIDGHIGPPEATQDEESWVDEFVALERALKQTEPPTD